MAATAGGCCVQAPTATGRAEVCLERCTADLRDGPIPSPSLVPKTSIQRVRDLERRPFHVCQHTPAAHVPARWLAGLPHHSILPPAVMRRKP
jgi:hypothetical protein